ncbi:peptide chain release factor N(5)-glutamine methyltransferase [Leptospira sp. GIMC2001]|uniref:peptide chain release factor N(5)-glutamine methyltransferase n=1 Tax=Leptospira sp. GIMC2001 TaxID=1513297 RepID=UPI00234A188E|nr:peptide chain release factor N(5)-glutamine methyltransferase [Leptospira sp. GIMC2001]WCL50546.1 peptide chain release factor N(5)-glutamine methyltransferase [Leptospira sp. GIMC2001]
MEENNLLYFLKKSTTFLEKKNIANPRLEAEILISHVLGLSRIQLYARFDRPLNESETNLYRELILKRSQNIPTAYIVGKKNFYGLDFAVNPSVLIPRPETEELVEYVLKKIFPNSDSSNLSVLDLCCGSGCIGICIQKNNPSCYVDFLDISNEALEVTRLNYMNILEGFHQEEKSHFYLSDLFTDHPIDCKYNLIVSNPPYVLPSEEESLSLDVQKEPRLALVVDDFDAFHKRLLTGAKERLVPNGKIMIETNPIMMKSLKELAESIGMTTEVIVDLSNKERFLLATK